MRPFRVDKRFCVKVEDELRSFLWMSLLPEGGISVGFTDGEFNVSKSDFYSLDRGSGAVESTEIGLVKNPHFTLHPPAYFHLKGEDGTVLCQALVWKEPSPERKISPWLKFTSNPLETLSPFLRGANGRPVDIHRLSAPHLNCSIEAHVDFVHANRPPPPQRKNFMHLFTWGDAAIRVSAGCVPPQPARLGYHILG